LKVLIERTFRNHPPENELEADTSNEFTDTPVEKVGYESSYAIQDSNLNVMVEKEPARVVDVDIRVAK
jgi:hypothetical protein